MRYNVELEVDGYPDSFIIQVEAKDIVEAMGLALEESRETGMWEEHQESVKVKVHIFKPTQTGLF